MALFIGIVVLAVSTLVCAYLSLLSFQADGDGSVLFPVFSAVSLAFLISLLQHWWQTRRAGGSESRAKNDLPAPVTFVPHSFLMTAIAVALIAILAAILVPLVFRLVGFSF